MTDPTYLHDDEWETGWKSNDRALYREGRFQLVCDLISPLFPNRIFDIGCGNGYQTEILKKFIPGLIVNGCDISPAAVDRASKRMNSCYVWDIDSSDLPESSESYDFVLCIAVLEHLYDVSHALKEINRILKLKKYALIQVPNLSFWRFRVEVLIGRIPYILQDPRHLHSFNKGFLIEKMKHSGFTNFHIYGQRQRLKRLASLSPSLFSEDIFVLAQKNL